MAARSNSSIVFGRSLAISKRSTTDDMFTSNESKVRALSMITRDLESNREDKAGKVLDKALHATCMALDATGRHRLSGTLKTKPSPDGRPEERMADRRVPERRMRSCMLGMLDAKDKST